MNYELENLDVVKNVKKLAALFGNKGLPAMVMLSLVLSLSTPFILFPSAASAAATFINSQTGDNTKSGGPSLTINAPSSISSGDFLLASISVSLSGNSNSVITAPSGWTSVLNTPKSGDVQISTYYKIAGSSEVGPYTWSLDHNLKAVGGILHYTGVNIASPIDVSAGSTNHTSTAVAPSVTTTLTNDLVVSLFAVDENPTVTTPAGMTEHYDASNPNSHGPSIAADDVLQPAIGASGSKSATISTGSENWAAQQIAIKSFTTTSITPSITSSNKVYDGNTAATSNCSLTGVVNPDVVTCSATTTNFDNKNVGTGKTVTATGITLSGADAWKYQLSSTSATTNADITALPINVTTNSGQTKVYGDVNPVYTYTNDALVSPDVLTGALIRTSGESVGNYAINQGTLTAGSNYTITFVPADFVITQKAITVTADAKSKIVGNSDPALTYQVTSGSVVLGDSFSGSLDRVAGEDIGSYAINQNTLTLGGNYNLSYVGANLVITDKIVIDVTAEAKSKTYGDADPELTYTYTPSLNEGDTFSGVLARGTGENFGTYAIGQGTLSLNPDTYVMNFTGANLTINKKALTVTAVTDTKVYDGTTASVGVPTILETLVGSDTANFTQTFDDRNVGGEKTLTPAGTINDGNSGNNYSYTFNITSGSITALPITVTAVTDTKLVDGNTSSVGVPTITVGALASPDTATWTQTFDTAAVGTGKTLTPAGTVSDGNSGLNYTVTFVPNTTGSITETAPVVTHTLTYTAGANGSITGTLSQTVNDGASGSAVTPVGNAGFHFLAWSDNTLDNPRTDTNVTTNIAVTASFASDSAAPTTTGGGGGGGGGAGAAATPDTTPVPPPQVLGASTTNSSPIIDNGGYVPPVTAPVAYNPPAANNGGSGNTQPEVAGSTDVTPPTDTQTPPPTVEALPAQPAALSDTGSFWPWFWLILLLIILALLYYWYRRTQDKNNAPK